MRPSFHRAGHIRRLESLWVHFLISAGCPHVRIFASGTGVVHQPALVFYGRNWPFIALDATFSIGTQRARAVNMLIHVAEAGRAFHIRSGTSSQQEHTSVRSGAWSSTSGAGLIVPAHRPHLAITRPSSPSGQQSMYRSLVISHSRAVNK
jgi:hypothetical protein